MVEIEDQELGYFGTMRRKNHLSRAQSTLPHWNLGCPHRLLLDLQPAAAAAAGVGGDDDVGGVADHDLLHLRLLPLGRSIALRESLVSSWKRLMPTTTPCSGLKV